MQHILFIVNNQNQSLLYYNVISPITQNVDASKLTFER